MPVPQPCPHCDTLLVPGAGVSTVFCPGCGAEVTLVVEAPAPKIQPKKPAVAAPVRPAAGGPPIPFECGRCGQPFKAASEDAGKRSRCPSCGSEIVVPEPPPPPLEPLGQDGPPADSPSTPRPDQRTMWLLVLLAVLALTAVYWSWWGLVVPGVLLGAAWGLRPRG